MSLGKWLGLVILLVSLYILWQIRQVLLLLFTAVVLASALNTFVLYLGKRGLKRSWAVALTIVLALGITSLFCLLVIPPFITQSQEFAELVPKSIARIDEWTGWVESQFSDQSILGPQVFNTVNGVINNLTQEIPNVARGVFSNFLSLFSSSLLVLLNILLIFVLTIMLLVDPNKYRRMLIRLVPSFYRRRTDEILSLCDTALDNWIIGILFNMTVIAVCSGIGLWILGVKLVLANALIAGLMEAIPNIGPTLSLIPPMAVALLDAPWKAFAVLIFYVLLQQLEQYILVPTVMAKQLDLPPAITLLSQIIFALFFGFLGLLLALPLVIVGQIWFKEVIIKDVLDRWDRPPNRRSLDPAQGESIAAIESEVAT
ncbi:MAG: AI-2E family transporter [Thermosynechococcaceae cyanobacterium]